MQKKCFEHISRDRPNEINDEFWKISDSERKLFMMDHTTSIAVKQLTTKRNSRGSSSVYYFLQTKQGEEQATETSSPATLGYGLQNDSILRHLLSTKRTEKIVPNLPQLEIKYFEREHTFMSAESFHHAVEQQLKKGKVYDFQAFQDCMKGAHSKVKVINMAIRYFYAWKYHTSLSELNKADPRLYTRHSKKKLLLWLQLTAGLKNLNVKDSFKHQKRAGRLPTAVTEENIGAVKK
ncbi:hypothetical protein ILUMI_16897 [Ignelater luminosus]|uniref:Uncharacterized protein n=1 Tax=Ignelater luminosus TaxID=2038154 RepID=A0A8K0G833_IGNLU|nr:hypothetical protein ILUMI_16897 [Ignelater luminosus]